MCGVGVGALALARWRVGVADVRLVNAFARACAGDWLHPMDYAHTDRPTGDKLNQDLAPTSVCI